MHSGIIYERKNNNKHKDSTFFALKNKLLGLSFRVRYKAQLKINKSYRRFEQINFARDQKSVDTLGSNPNYIR